MSLCFKLTLEIVKLFHTHTCQKQFWQAPLKPFSFICIPTIPKSNAENPPTPRWVFCYNRNFPVQSVPPCLFFPDSSSRVTFNVHIFFPCLIYWLQPYLSKVVLMVLPLSYAKPGQQLRIIWIASEPQTRQRLAVFGFIPNETLTCVLTPVCKGMGAYRVRGSLIALRWENINEIFATEIFPSVPSDTPCL